MCTNSAAGSAEWVQNHGDFPCFLKGYTQPCVWVRAAVRLQCAEPRQQQGAECACSDRAADCARPALQGRGAGCQLHAHYVHVRSCSLLLPGKCLLCLPLASHQAHCSLCLFFSCMSVALSCCLILSQFLAGIRLFFLAHACLQHIVPVLFICPIFLSSSFACYSAGKDLLISCPSKSS